MPYAPRYIDSTMVAARVSAAVLRECFDDDNNGTADDAPVLQVIQDAEAYVEGFLRGIYTIPITGTIPTELQRLVLDVVHAYMAMRHPEAFRLFDGPKMLDQARVQCMDLRKGITRLNVMAAPEPGANQGGSLTSAVDEDSSTAFQAPEKIFVGGMGDF